MDRTEPLKQTAYDVEERVRQKLDESAQTLTALTHRVTDFIRENPGKCLVLALSAGYVVGRIARRK